jgi:hypothetical protein
MDPKLEPICLAAFSEGEEDREITTTTNDSFIKQS